MSALVANASPLKAEIRLAQAVSEFEADLSSDQKAMFRSYKAQTCSSPPTPDDVMLLTALIDRRASGKVVGGRCFGPRFCNVLQAVQQFAALGDILIGGSQNLIACGVWSLVRMTLLMFVTSNSYLEKLSQLFMTVGRSAPRYQMMALLYPRSKILQSSLSEYFIVVVRLCHSLLKFTKKSSLGQVFSSLSDSDIKTAETQLIAWATSIKEEVVLLSSKKIEEEAQENSRFRAVSSRFSETASHRKRLERNRRVLNACSTYDYETTWKQIRKLGNTTLLDQNAEYQNWKIPDTSATSSTFICMGKLGSGKSVLLANAVDDICLHVQEKRIGVAYFFCRHDILESLQARVVFGSLARQLLRSFPDLSATEDLLDENAPVLGIDDIYILLQRTISPNFKAYFILDGLDECSHAEREELVYQLRRLQKIFTLFICLSYRLEAGNNSKLQFLINPTIISIPDANPDIEDYIVAELENYLKSGTLSIGDPALILEIRDALLDGAQGMFLWVNLQLKSLCVEQTDEAIRQALSNLPKDLPETFSRILDRSKDQGGSYQQRILELVSIAQRPLTTEELREALSVVPGDTNWNSTRLINDFGSTLLYCGSLIMVDEEELTVRVIHHSAKKFLLSGRGTASAIPFSFKAAHTRMADIVITYLNYGIFETQLSSIVVPQINIASTPSNIVRSSMSSSSVVRSLALQLLVPRNQLNQDIGKVLAGASKHFKARPIDEHHFYAYAKLFWFYHTWTVRAESGAPMCDLLRRIEENALGSTVNILPKDYGKPLLWATRCGYTNIVEDLLLDERLVDIGEKDPALLWVAIVNGNDAIIKLLLDSRKVGPEVINGSRGSTDWASPIWWAMTVINEGMLDMLLRCDKTDLSITNDAGETLLWWALKGRQLTAMKQLLDSGRIDPNETGQDGETPLWWSISHQEYQPIALLLKNSKVNANIRNADGYTPLAQAAIRGDDFMVQLLLSSGTVNGNVESSDEPYPTELLYNESRSRPVEAKKYLPYHHTNKVNVNAANAQGLTPLSCAASRGHREIVELLLNTCNCKTGAKDHDGNTAYKLAHQNGHGGVCNILLSYVEEGFVSKKSTRLTTIEEERPKRPKRALAESQVILHKSDRYARYSSRSPESFDSGYEERFGEQRGGRREPLPPYPIQIGGRLGHPRNGTADSTSQSPTRSRSVRRRPSDARPRTPRRSELRE
ncbi:uncharacterized protein LY89DRAFT_328989 [Mollisia scopiformis]|uniref:Uncharacterized protein n=1 Tax=Mollisia scopiformis TaxID=149040 RepID=A0A132B924_MOLSC|nr:uncharacterized protein LY89DRAFT_328989 [Mollisia scopiformis]KUJ08906.1 hypothetical protein LY89DRAFT_328989 [Mollisia scopiformis]